MRKALNKVDGTRAAAGAAARGAGAKVEEV